MLAFYWFGVVLGAVFSMVLFFGCFLRVLHWPVGRRNTPLFRAGSGRVERDGVYCHF